MVRNLSRQSPSSRRFLKQRSMTFKHDRHRCRCPRGCTKHRCQRLIFRTDDLSSELQDAAVDGILLDDLHTLTGDLRMPVLSSLKIWVKLSERSESLFVRLYDLTDKILGESHVVSSHGEEGQKVLRVDCFEHVEVRAMLQELRRKAGIRPKQDRTFFHRCDGCRDAEPTSEESLPMLCHRPSRCVAKRPSHHRNGSQMPLTGKPA